MPSGVDLVPMTEKSGWPWQIGVSGAELCQRGEPGVWPRISIVTPSYNQAAYLEETLRSVLLQGYPNLEYIIIDGGSTDGSQEILRNYSDQLTYWVSEPDEGQTHALNKGFARASGDWLAWLNSDDYLLPGALFELAKGIKANPEVDWFVGTTVAVDRHGKILERLVPRVTNGAWTDYVCTRQSGVELPQPSTFWSRKAWLETGNLDESFQYAMDHEYWGRLARKGFYPYCLDRELAAFRRYDGSKTSEGLLPFFLEELQVVDMRTQNATPMEKQALSDCRVYLVNSIKKLKHKSMCKRLCGKILDSLRMLGGNSKGV